MIIWKKFNKDTDPTKIAETVGMCNDTESNLILVMARFASFPDEFTPNFARVNKHRRLEDIVSVSGMSGNIIISHWSEVNFPDTATMATMEDVNTLIKQLNNTSPNNKK